MTPTRREFMISGAIDYEDGTTEEFTGPVGSRLPSPVTKLKKPPSADVSPAASK